jgi:hypothetical protein
MIKNKTLIALAVISGFTLAGCGEAETVTPASEETQTEQTSTVVDDEIGFFNKNLNEDIVEKDGSIEGLIPADEDGSYVYVVLESSIINISDNFGAVERIFTDSENVLTFYHVPGSRGNIDL